MLAQGVTTVDIREQVEFARWSAGNALLVGGVVTAAALYAVSWMYRREGRGALSRRVRWTLIGCRAAVLALLGVVGLEPVIVRYVHRRLDAATIVLIDASASMSLADRYREPDDAARAEAVAGPLPEAGVPRVELAERVLNAGDRSLLGALAENNPVRVFAFSDGLVPVADTGGASNRAATTRPNPASPLDSACPRIQAAGSVTNVGQAVRGAVDSLGGSPAAAIVVLSDGGFNEGEPPAVVAEFLRRKNVPLHAVGVGDPSPPINVRVAEVSAPRSVFKNDPFSVTVRLDGEGVAGQTITVELLERRMGDSRPPRSNSPEARLVETREVVGGPDGRIDALVFQRKVAEPGAVSYVARARPVPFEAVASDNEREVLPAVQVLDDRMRVLLVAGAPSYDYRFLARLLERDKTVDLSTWLQSADVAAVRDGNTVITELPNQPEDLFKYDAILLLDCDPREFDPTWGSLVAAFVNDHGGGLLYAAGNKYAGSFFRSPSASSIVELLPIVPDPEAEIRLNDLGHYQTRSWPIVFPEANAFHPILRQADRPADSRAVWAAMDGVYWHYPVYREKTVATVLMQHSNPRTATSFGPQVLLATQLVGAGRTAWLGINSTSRWRRGDEVPFNRFWIQMVRYLVEGRLLGGRHRGSIQTDRDQFEVGESVVVTARALDERFAPLLLPELEMRVTSDRAVAADFEPDGPPTTRPDDSSPAEDADLVPLAPVPGREGYYQGRFTPRRTGTLRLSIALPGAAVGEPARLEKQIVVSQPDIEMRSPAMHRDSLKQFAAAAGGRYFDVDEAAGVSGLIPDCSRTFVVRERPRQLWDNQYVLMLLVALLFVEWALRKKAKLL